MGTDKPLVRCVALLRHVAGAVTGEDGMGVNSYLISFFQGRDNLSNAHPGHTGYPDQGCIPGQQSAGGVLNQTRRAAGDLAQSRETDNLDNESNEYTRGISQNFTGKRNAPRDDSQRSFQENKQHLLDLVNTMEATMAVKFEAVRTRAAQTQAPQE